MTAAVTVAETAAVLRRAALSPPSDEEALSLAELDPSARERLRASAAERRDRAFGDTLTYSPKVFLPLTNLCRNRCDYCSFRRSPGEEGEWTMAPSEVRHSLDRAATEGCVEALFCLGDTPESAFSAYRTTLADLGQPSTVAYLHASGRAAIEAGLLPHTNAGILDSGEMRRLREVNVSLGLMLENVSPRLCEPGMPHRRAPDKQPQKRLRMLEEAGALRIPFTTGILIGIGETRRERIETLLAIRDSHRRHGHIQEVIVQNFRAHPGTRMADAPEPDDDEIAESVALARILLPDDISVQAPPNLNPGGTASLVGAGINDFGGISPVTPDFINSRHPWPHITRLAAECAEVGKSLAPRLPIYPRYLDEDGWVDPALRERCRALQSALPVCVPAGTSVGSDDALERSATRPAAPRPLAVLG